MNLTNKVRLAFFAGSLAASGCAATRGYQAVLEVNTPEKLVEFYDTNKDSKLDKMNVWLKEPVKEICFEGVLITARISYGARDSNFNGIWDAIGKVAIDVNTKNTIDCKLVDLDDNGVYEKGFFSVRTSRRFEQFVFKDLTGDGEFDVLIFDGITIDKPSLLWDFNYYASRLRNAVKEDLKRVEDYKP